MCRPPTSAIGRGRGRKNRRGSRSRSRSNRCARRRGRWRPFAASRSGSFGRTTRCRGSRRVPTHWPWASRSGCRAETGASRSLSATIEDAGPMIASTPPVMSESRPIAADAAVAPSSALINCTSKPMTPPASLICSVAISTASTMPSPNSVAPGPVVGSSTPSTRTPSFDRAGGLVVVTTAWVVVGALSPSSEQLIAATATAPTQQESSRSPVDHRLTIEEPTGSTPSGRSGGGVVRIGARPTLGRNGDEHRRCRSPGCDRRHGARRTRTLPCAVGGHRCVARRPLRRRARPNTPVHHRPHSWRSVATGAVSWRRTAISIC